MAKKQSKTDSKKKKTDSKSKAKNGKSSTGRNVAMAVGTAAAAVAVGAAVRQAMKSGKTVYEVKSHDDGWQVFKDGASRASSVHPTKKEAVSEARDLAASQAPSKLYIYKQDGELDDSHTYEPEDE